MMDTVTSTRLKRWLLGALLLVLVLSGFFALGVYAGSQGMTTPTVPPWPEPGTGGLRLSSPVVASIRPAGVNVLV